MMVSFATPLRARIRSFSLVVNVMGANFTEHRPKVNEDPGGAPCRFTPPTWYFGSIYDRGRRALSQCCTS